MNFEPIKGHMSGFIMVMMVAVFTLIAVTGICFLRRIAIFKKKSPKSLKMIGWYVLDFAGFELAGIGIGLLFQSPFTGENLSAVMKYLGQCVLLTTVIYLVAFVAIGALLMLIVNFVFVDKPFRFFGTADEPVFEDEGMDNYDVAGSFDVNASSSGAGRRSCRSCGKRRRRRRRQSHGSRLRGTQRQRGRIPHAFGNRC